MTSMRVKPPTEGAPFLDFYREHAVSPVSQDIRDLQKHYDRRESLYLALGILPIAVRGMHVLELGPGSGYNSIYTQSLRPQSYTLVEGNPVGLEQTRTLMGEHYPDARSIAYFESKIEDFTTDQSFDLIICEGLIPYQNEPVQFARGLHRFAHAGSVICMTTCDAVSTIGEFSRRLYADALIPYERGFDERLAVLTPVFARHLAALPGVSRPADDWIIDNILQPLRGKTFSIPDAISAMAAGNADFYASSPQFVRDWRWYKNQHGAQKHMRELAIEQFYENILNHIDYRFTFPSHSADFGRTLEKRANKFFTAVQRYESGDFRAREEAITALAAVEDHVRELAPQSAEAMKAARTAIAAAHAGKPVDDTAFTAYFGRGQQNVSFIVRP